MYACVAVRVSSRRTPPASLPSRTFGKTLFMPPWTTIRKPDPPDNARHRDRHSDRQPRRRRQCACVHPGQLCSRSARRRCDPDQTDLEWRGGIAHNGRGVDLARQSTHCPYRIFDNSDQEQHPPGMSPIAFPKGWSTLSLNQSKALPAVSLRNFPSASNASTNVVPTTVTTDMTTV